MKCASPSSVSGSTKSSLLHSLPAIEDEQNVNHVYVPSGENAQPNSWSGQPYVPESEMMDMPDLDFQLIWPDSEDLFHSIMSSDTSAQMPLGTLPFPQSLEQFTPTSLDSPNSFDDRGTAIKAIPNGGGHRAVHGVTKMITNLVNNS